MTVSKITDHETQAKNRLISQWRNKPNLGFVVGAIQRQIQGLENTLWEMFTLSVASAFGASLDFLGRLVGVQRAGRSDEVFRKLIRVQVSVNKSRGKNADLRAISAGLFGVGAFRVIHSPPHSVQVEAQLAEVPGLEKSLLEAGAEGATRVDVHAYDPASTALRWGTSDLFVTSSNGMASGDSFNVGTGGIACIDL